MDDPQQALEQESVRQATSMLPLPSCFASNAEMRWVENKYEEQGKGPLLAIRKAGMRIVFKNRLIFSHGVEAVTGGGDISGSILVALFAKSWLGRLVVGFLFPSVRDLTSLSMTCRVMRGLVAGYFVSTVQSIFSTPILAPKCSRVLQDVWDMSTGSFPTHHYERKTTWAMKHGRCVEVLVQGGGVRDKILLVEGVGAEDMVEDAPYAELLSRFVKLTSAVRLIPASFRKLVLHRVPFLDASVVGLLVNDMPNLETLAVTDCLLMDMTSLVPLLATLGKLSGMQRPVVDFGPARFGRPKLGDSHVRGNFLVTHNEPSFDLPKAAIALVCRCLPEATRLGVDLLGDSSSFWLFLRDIPGPCPIWAWKAREVLKRYGVAGWGNMSDAMEDDLAAAVGGDGVDQAYRKYKVNGKLVEEKGGERWYWRGSGTCRVCCTTLPKSLLRHRGHPPVCWGCRMISFVSAVETSHFRDRMRAFLEGLIRDLPAQMLESFVHLASTRGVVTARHIDDAWRYYRSTNHVLGLAVQEERGQFPFGKDYKIRPFAASMRRWMLSQNPVQTAVDWRYGGPQIKHPCSIEGHGALPLGAPLCSLTVYGMGWTREAKHDAAIMQRFEMVGLRGEGYEAWLDRIGPTGMCILSRAMMEKDLARQTRTDWSFYHPERQEVEFDKYSFCTSGRVAYSRDKMRQEQAVINSRW